jgi:mono/diheme cytochrome c family protein
MLLRADLFAALALPVGIALMLQASPDQRAPTPADRDPTHAVSFAEQVMPIFEARCVECHGASDAELGLNLSTYEGVMAGSDYGTVIEKGNPEGSLLIDMIASGDMPEEGDPVPAEELDLIRTWIQEGAENN